MILSLIKSAVFGIVEGLTEFLPISSTGHLILLDAVMKLSDNTDFTNIFEVAIQSGAILAVILIYFKKLWPINKDFKFDKEKLNLWLYIIIAFIPAIVFGFLFKDFISEKLFNPITVSTTLIFYGVALIMIEKFLNTKGNFGEKIGSGSASENASETAEKQNIMSNLSLKKALLIGLFQVLAMIPGTSRSAATIIGGLLVGLSRENAAEFSFFLAIPTIVGAGVFSIFDAKIAFTNEMIYTLIVGFLFSFIVALVVIKAFIRFIQKHNFNIFGWYRIALGIIVIALLVF
ncbi:MAG: undecaprenyl-diphosphate phosphatase [Exilispira sp.]|jgi:undecaprenyl-diphosphatase|nr:undecaprenyl-diphosphate phosphatase [Exilispira sp.]